MTIAHLELKVKFKGQGQRSKAKVEGRNAVGKTPSEGSAVLVSFALTVSWWTALVGVHVNGKYHLDNSMKTDVDDHDDSAPGRQCQLRHVQSQEHRHHCKIQTHRVSVSSTKYCHVP